MTEDEWLDDGKNSQSLVYGLLRLGKIQRTKAGKRRLRLFACACCRLVWHHFERPILGRVVEATECFADGLIGRAELDALLPEVNDLNQDRGPHDRRGDEMRTATSLVRAATHKMAGEAACCMTAYRVYLTRVADGAEAGEAAIRHLLRDVLGNPFRPAAVERRLKTRTVLSLAQAASDERLLPSGHLDPVRLAVLSDALEEAGASGEILAHLRSPGAHVRGCWALDLVLGKV